MGRNIMVTAVFAAVEDQLVSGLADQMVTLEGAPYRETLCCHICIEKHYLRLTVLRWAYFYQKSLPMTGFWEGRSAGQDW